MNGMGMPGGEHALGEIFKEQGIEGVASQFNYTMPVFKAKDLHSPNGSQHFNPYELVWCTLLAVAVVAVVLLVLLQVVLLLQQNPVPK